MSVYVMSTSGENGGCRTGDDDSCVKKLVPREVSAPEAASIASGGQRDPLIREMAKTPFEVYRGCRAT